MVTNDDLEKEFIEKVKKELIAEMVTNDGLEKEFIEKVNKELIAEYTLMQSELDAFNDWYLKNKYLLDGKNPKYNKYTYKLELQKFLKIRNKFCEDEKRLKGMLFNSQAEFAFAMFLELLGIKDFQTQTYVQEGQVDFFIPRLNLIVEVDGQDHYLGYENGHLDKEKSLLNISGILQEVRVFQKAGFIIFRYLADNIYYHRNGKPSLDKFFLSTLADDFVNLIQNEDDIKRVKCISHIPKIDLPGQ